MWNILITAGSRNTSEPESITVLHILQYFWSDSQTQNVEETTGIPPPRLISWTKIQSQREIPHLLDHFTSRSTSLYITITPNHRAGGLPYRHKLQGNFHLQKFGRFPHSQADFFHGFFPVKWRRSKSWLQHNALKSKSANLPGFFFVYFCFLCRFFSVQNWQQLAP